ncbi:hypothetical protein GCM10007088_12280 [Porphyromonas pasteri]|uniref:Uncharacterized protein n=1 Tax=Porphyromonas pasteri TaxID=1583331 RepID=A0ABQ2H7B9_9PORP|nr:hypothetical protein GCM10007088_12280 [Porphyromonas pasteri]
MQRDHRARLTLEERHIIERLTIVRTIDLHREKHTALRRIAAIKESRQEGERLLNTAIREEAQSPHIESQDGSTFGKDPTSGTKQRTIPPQTDDKVHIQRTVVCWYITRYRGMQIEVRGQRAVEATVTPQAHIRPIKKVKELGKMGGMSRKV